MVIGGNQPYFIPYIGYWQLINAVDCFILGDDYNYIERGWINRNRILQNGKPTFFNIEIDHASSNKPINALYLSPIFNAEKKLLQLRTVYRKAPYFEDGFSLMQKILQYEERNVAAFLTHSIHCICDYLEINTEIITSSSIPNNSELKKEYRIYDFCTHLGADTVVNAIGGRELYTYEQFAERGIKLGFIQSGEIQYSQFSSDFIPNLSIIDVIMFNPKDKIKKMLKNYTILWEDEATKNA